MRKNPSPVGQNFASRPSQTATGRVTDALMHHFGIDEVGSHGVLVRDASAVVASAKAVAANASDPGEPSSNAGSSGQGPGSDVTARPGPSSLKMLLAVHYGRVTESAGPIPGSYVFAGRAAYLWIAHLSTLGLVTMPDIGPPEVTATGDEILKSAGLIA
jgi:hypothetical protein